MPDRQAIREQIDRIDREISRGLPGQETALATLDWMFAGRALVHCDYDEKEWSWLSGLTIRLRALVLATGATGVRAMWIGQMALWLLEATLSDFHAAGSVPSHSESPSEAGACTSARRAAAGELNQANLSLLCVNFMESSDGELVTRICDSLADEFGSMPARMCVDLADQCLAYEHPLDPLEFFCWMLQMGVLHSKRYSKKAAAMRPGIDTLRRIGMQCQLEAVRAYRATKGAAPASFTDERRKANTLPSIAVDGYLSSSAIISTVANNPLLLGRASYADAVLRAGQWTTARRRRFEGTQAKWPGRLGALMVAITKLQEPDAPLYNSEDNAGRVTDLVATKLGEYGLSVAPRSLYESFVELTQSQGRAQRRRR